MNFTKYYVLLIQTIILLPGGCLDKLQISAEKHLVIIYTTTMGNFTSRLCQTPVPNLSFKEMCCLVVCCDSQVHIDYSDASDEEEQQQDREKKNPQKKIYQLLEKLYYERDRPSALGGVENLYQAARHYGLKRSQVIHWLQQQPGYTLQKLARKTFPRNKVFVNSLDEQWQCDLCDLTSLSQ